MAKKDSNSGVPSQTTVPSQEKYQIGGMDFPTTGCPLDHYGDGRISDPVPPYAGTNIFESDANHAAYTYVANGMSLKQRQVAGSVSQVALIFTPLSDKDGNQ